MKQDRFLVGILVGIGVLVVIALGLFFTRQDKQEYISDDTPKGVVHTMPWRSTRTITRRLMGIWLRQRINQHTMNSARLSSTIT